MKALTHGLGALAMLVALTGSAAALEARNPDFNGVFEALTPTNSRIALEPGKAQGAYKVSGFGLGMSGFYRIAGEHAGVRLKGADNPAFVVKVANPDQDPTSLFQLSRVDVKRGERILPATKYGLSEKNDMSGHLIELRATKIGGRSIKLAPAAPLAPGEYLIGEKLPDDAANAGARDVFCFGVD